DVCSSDWLDPILNVARGYAAGCFLPAASLDDLIEQTITGPMTDGVDLLSSRVSAGILPYLLRYRQFSVPGGSITAAITLNRAAMPLFLHCAPPMPLCYYPRRLAEHRLVLPTTEASHRTDSTST